MRISIVIVAACALLISPRQTLHAQTSPGTTSERSGTSAALPSKIKDSSGIELVFVPAGEFQMGGSEPAEELVKTFPQYGVQADFFHDEYPQHRVRITEPFYMGKYEVTNGQFSQFIEDANYKTEAEQMENSRRGDGGWGFNQGEQKFEGAIPNTIGETQDFPRRPISLWSM